jgi:site-specific DNA recombinase
MTPSFSTKNGVRYRFYVSSALLRGRKASAGSVGRVRAAQVEDAVRSALASHQQMGGFDDAPVDIQRVQRVAVGQDHLMIKIARTDDEDNSPGEIRGSWSHETGNSAIVIDRENASEGVHNESLIQAIVRAHVWLQQLADQKHGSIEELAEANSIHPKVVRLALRLAYLSPEIVSAILEGRQLSALTLARISKLLPLPWAKQHRSLSQNT